MNARAAVADASKRLRQAGVEAPVREARLIMALAQGKNDTMPDLDLPVPRAFAALLARREAREPMAFLRGQHGFWTLDLEVSRDTLIPRADSETLIEAALAAMPDRAGVRRVLDLGTGTGALLLATLVEYPQAWGVGIDRVPAAAALAARNAARHGLGGRAAFAAGEWATCLAATRFDIILANPPYVARNSIVDLMPEVSRYEPATALDGGADGGDAYRALLPALPGLLAEAGVAVLEVGLGQADWVARVAQLEGLSVLAVRADLCGVARAMVMGTNARGADAR